MMGRSHMIIGAIAGAAISPPEMLPLAIGAGVIGSISPDIDHTGSTMGKALIPISFFLSKVCSHRGFTHSLAAIAIVFLLSNHFDNIIGWAFLAGYVSHIFLDMLTPMGVSLLAPITNHKTSFLNIRTGSFAEPFMVFLIAIISIVIASFTNQETFGIIHEAVVPAISSLQNLIH